MRGMIGRPRKETARAYRLHGVDLFLSEPGGIFEGLLDVLFFKIWIVDKNLFGRHAMGDLASR